jgi:8-oxo-dGTP pyrophosphatase MutT (NUDIX family)
MRKVVRAIIKKDNALLLIKRVKNDQTYWVFAGGGVEEDEDQEEALIRECKEELGLDVEARDFVFEYVFQNETLGEQKEYFYNCKIIGGQLGTGDGPEYNQTEKDSRNFGTYQPMWINFDQIKSLDIRPVEMKNKLEKIKASASRKK